MTTRYTICPLTRTSQARLALAMGFDSWNALSVAIEEQRAIVTRRFREVVFRNEGVAAHAGGDGFAAAWRASADAEEWKTLLQEHGVDTAQGFARAACRLPSSSVCGTTGCCSRSATGRINSGPAFRARWSGQCGAGISSSYRCARGHPASQRIHRVVERESTGACSPRRHLRAQRVSRGRDCSLPGAAR